MLLPIAHWLKNALPLLICSASKAKNICPHIINDANAWLSTRHKKIEIRADHGNAKFAQTISESKRSKPSPKRSQRKEMCADQSPLLTRKLTRP